MDLENIMVNRKKLVYSLGNLEVMLGSTLVFPGNNRLRLYSIHNAIQLSDWLGLCCCEAMTEVG